MQICLEHRPEKSHKIEELGRVVWKENETWNLRFLYFEC